MSNINTLKKQRYVKLYNPTGSEIIIPLHNPNNQGTRGCTIEGMKDGIPSYVDVTWEDVYFINDKTRAIKDGTVQFSKEDREAMYTELGIADWKNIFTEDIIDDIIKSPTIDKMERILDVKDLSVIDRIRGRLIYLINTDADVSVKVIDIVNQRYAEINKGIRKSNILLMPNEVVKPVDEKEVDKLKDELASLKAMIEKLSKEKE